MKNTIVALLLLINVDAFAKSSCDLKLGEEKFRVCVYTELSKKHVIRDDGAAIALFDSTGWEKAYAEAYAEASAELQGRAENKINVSKKREIKSECEDVNDQYVICNGNKYVRSTDTSENLKRTGKAIEQHSNPKKTNAALGTVQK